MTAMNTNIALVLVLALLVSACSSAGFVRTLDTGNGAVEVGLTGQQVMAILGPPDRIRGYSNFAYARSLGFERGGVQTTEWVWHNAVPGKVVVVYFEDQIAIRIATIRDFL